MAVKDCKYCGRWCPDECRDIDDLQARIDRALELLDDENRPSTFSTWVDVRNALTGEE